MKKEKSQGGVSYGAFFCMVLVALALVFYGLVHTSNLQNQKDYYKTQMTTFCEITLTQHDLLEKLSTPEIKELLPKMEECDYWLLEGDKE